jgi:hypothetical protein
MKFFKAKYKFDKVVVENNFSSYLVYGLTEKVKEICPDTPRELNPRGSTIIFDYRDIDDLKKKYVFAQYQDRLFVLKFEDNFLKKLPYHVIIANSCASFPNKNN